MQNPRIRLVTFDALHTLITPRRPIHEQYSRCFALFLGPLDSNRVKAAFKVALKELQQERPVYDKGTTPWWSEVIKRTAIGAGADKADVESALGSIVSELMKAFSSKEGYKAFDDTFPTLRHLTDDLKLRTAVISNADARIRMVMEDLEFPETLGPIVLSEEEGVEKPNPDIFDRTLRRVNASESAQGRRIIKPEECLHVGDEFASDYQGALAAGMQALWLYRPDLQEIIPEGAKESLTVKNLSEVVEWLKRKESAIDSNAGLY